MKTLTVVLMGVFLSGCVAHAHVTSPTARVHTQVAPLTVKAWVWVAGDYSHGHWIPAHWAIRWVEPRVLRTHPRRYVRHTPTQPKPLHKRQRRHRRHR